MIISYEDFLKGEVRSGMGIRADLFPRAKKPTYKIWVDFRSELEVPQTSAQVKVHYTPESLQG